MNASRLKLSFLGGASAIGASSTLLEAGDRKILVDCGVRFRTDRPLPDLDELSGLSLDAIVLTHAHSDHSGALPVLHDAFPGTPIYMTPPTADLVGILQRDALKLMGSAAEREGELPLYGERQVEQAMAAFRRVHHGVPVTVGDLELTFLPASHILGASMLHVASDAGSVLFTGDYSVSAQRTVPALARPRLRADLLVTESTYGNRLHADRKSAEARMVGRIAEVLERGGRVLVPAFAIGRAQEVLLIVRAAQRAGRLPKVPVFVDGMVRAVCDVYAGHERYVTEALAREIRASGHPFFSDPVRPIRHRDERKAALEAGPCIFVASSGMLAGGPSAFYAAELAPNEQDAIFITGYQDEESPGRALLRLAEQQAGPRELRLGERTVEVRCTFETYGLSAHADRMQMLGFAEALRPRGVVLVHGDREAKAALHGSLGQTCPDVELAEDGMQISRAYPPRRRGQPIPEAREMRPEALAALLGPPTGRPVPLVQLAEAWFGRKPDAAALERLAGRLEELGLARRDDERREMLWPQTPAADEGEAELEEQLKRENPKGRLLELCMRRRLPQPRLFETTQAGRFVAEYGVEVDGEQVLGGVQQAGSRKLAEQLAARALLERLGEREGAEQAEAVDEEISARLKRENPKGRLLERCMQHKLPPPAVESVAVPGGVRARMRLELPGRALESRSWQAPRVKEAEQAAAAELLQALEEALAGGLEPAQAGASGQAAPGGGRRAEPLPFEPRMRLNEMRQKGLVEDFGLELRGQGGPAHRPHFVVQGWARAAPGPRDTSSTRPPRPRARRRKRRRQQPPRRWCAG
jgi:Cft2 family RNA processing exonuclease/dsRNA-specific ribonuclease